MKKIRWGIISTGTIARSFASDCRHVATASLCAVASRSIDKANAFAHEFGIPRAYGSYEELYADNNIDAVYIATPHNFHYQNTVDALHAGKAVLCEKPITISPEECDSLIRCSRQTNNYLMEGMWTYFLPAIRQAVAWVSDGRIGKIQHVKADFGYAVPFDAEGRMFNPALAGGALLDMGVYTLAITNLFMTTGPSEMTVLARQATTGVDHDVIMLLTYADAAATLTTSFRGKLHNQALIIGEKGYVQIPDFWRARECFLYQGEMCTDHFADHRSSLGFDFEISAVNNDILAGRNESLVMPLKESLRLQQQLQQVKDRFAFRAFSTDTV